MVKMIMHGCNGKMGQVITKIVKEDANAEIVAGIDKYINASVVDVVYSVVSLLHIFNTFAHKKLHKSKNRRFVHKNRRFSH